MSALTIAVKTLLAGSGVTALAGQRVYPLFAPQDAKYPNIIIHGIYGAEEELLQGASQWPEARISIECRGSGTNPVADADILAEAVVDWLRDKLRYGIDGCEATFRKEGTDETSVSGNFSQQGIPVVARRTVDFYLRYRRV